MLQTVWTRAAHCLHRCSIQPWPLYRSYATLPTHLTIQMPALSPTMTQGNWVQWKKKLGDRVQPGDVLAEVETDKAQIDFECQEEGYVAALLVENGEKEIKIGTPVAVLVEEKSNVAAFKDYKVSSSSAAATPSAPSAPSTETSVKDPAIAVAPAAEAASSSNESTNNQSTSGRIFASPLARHLAREQGIEIEKVAPGSGPHQRVIKSDVEAFVKKNGSITATTASATATTPTPAAPSKETSNVNIAGYKEIPLTNMRKVIAQRLTASTQQVPHFYLTVDVDVTEVLALRQRLNAKSNKESEFKLSVNDFVIKATALALRRHPTANSAWHDSVIRQHETVDISVAVSTPAGLITPIVFDADAKGLVETSREVQRLASLAKENKLQPAQFQGGTFTISNLGMFGVDHFTAIINPPQAAILAVGRSRAALVLPKDATDASDAKVRQLMSLTLSCDHRVLDGAAGAQFLSTLKALLESPETMLL